MKYRFINKKKYDILIVLDMYKNVIMYCIFVMFYIFYMYIQEREKGLKVIYN